MNLNIKNEGKKPILKTTEFFLIVFSLMILFASMDNDGKNIISIPKNTLLKDAIKVDIYIYVYSLFNLRNLSIITY